LYLLALDQREQPFHSWPLETFRRLASVYDYIEQLRAVNDGHGANLRRLRFERDARLRLAVRAHANVADSLHAMDISVAG